MSVDVLKYILPENAACYVCGAELKCGSGAHLCPDCEKELPLIDGPTCSRCGRPLKEEGLCEACLLFHHRYERNIACLTYEDLGKKWIRTYKYGGKSHLWRPFSEIMIDRLLRERPSVDRVVAVPMHWTRLFKRGFSQTRALAAPIADALHLPLDKQLVRVHRTPPLEPLNAEERRKALERVFAYKGDLTGERVLLVDDVMTTGATLDACASALRAAGAEKVICATLAVQVRGDNV